MSSFPEINQTVLTAAVEGNFEAVRALVEAGADLNAIDSMGDTFLEAVISELLDPPCACRVDMVRLLVSLGANLNLIGAEGIAPLTPAMLAMDTELLESMLKLGANPNLPGGFGSSESFYDWAETDYCYNVWFHKGSLSGSLTPPEEPDEADKASEDAWLEYLDRMAVKYEVRRPDHLRLLRQHGAKTTREMALAESGFKAST